MLMAGAARGQTDRCDGEGDQYVTLAVSDATLAGPLRAQLGAELRRRSIAVCPPESAGEVLLSRVSVDLDPSGRTASVTVVDDVTGKQSQRVVELGDAPPDGKLLVLAIGVDELLNASWAELVVRPVEAPTPLQVRVQRTVTQQVAARRERKLELGVVGAFETDARWSHRLGGGVGALVWPARRWGARVDVGFRLGPSVGFPDGWVESRGVTTSAALAFRPRGDKHRFAPTATLGVRGEWLVLVGQPEPAARGYTATTASVAGEAACGLGWRWNAGWRTSLDLGIGVPLVAPTARDGDTVERVFRAPLPAASLSVWRAP